jgi:hypothetical protein
MQRCTMMMGKCEATRGCSNTPSPLLASYKKIDVCKGIVFATTMGRSLLAFVSETSWTESQDHKVLLHASPVVNSTCIDDRGILSSSVSDRRLCRKTVPPCVCFHSDIFCTNLYVSFREYSCDTVCTEHGSKCGGLKRAVYWFTMNNNKQSTQIFAIFLSKVDMHQASK